MRNIWVSDTYNGRIEEFSEEGTYIRTVGAEGETSGPAGIAIDPHGKVWVADWLDERVEEFNESGEYLGAFGSKGTGEGQFEIPFGIAAESNGDIWVADLGNERLERFTPAGTYLSTLGSEGSGEGQFSFITAQIAITSDNGLSVNDAGNHRVEHWAPPAPPTNSVAPSISGPALTGETQTASTGEWAGVPEPSYAYQWESCDTLGEACLDIAAATESTYTPDASVLGDTLRVRVTASNSAGSASATSSLSAVVTAPTPPANTTPPTVSGTAQEGQTLTATVGSWEGTEPLEYSYHWQDCQESEACTEIEGATAATYQPEATQVGDTIRVLVIASNVYGDESAASAQTPEVSSSHTTPVNLQAPEITGTAQQGQPLGASLGVWAGAAPLSYTYQWQRCSQSAEGCNAVAGANVATYEPVEADVGATLRVLITASNTDGYATRISQASAMVQPASEVTEPACTEVWEGPSEGLWREQISWSTGRIPTGSDIVCVPSETTVAVVGAAQAGVLRDEGTLELSSGSLELAGTSEASTVSTLKMQENEPALTGAATVYVTNKLEWLAGEMSGSGRTVIAPGASATIKGGAFTPLLAGRVLVNEGTLTLLSNLFRLSEGALVENEGTFVDNSQTCTEGCVGVPGQILAGTGVAPRLLNTGVFQKASGSGTSTVAVPFTNDGSVRALSGTLRFVEGGVAGQAATGAWSVEGSGAITLGDGLFTFGEEVSLSAVEVQESASVERAAAPASSTAPSLSGTAQAGQTLSAEGGSWSGASPISLAYQWQRCNASGGKCHSLAGASEASYTLGPGDIAATVRVVVTASNVYGQALTASSASGVVLAPPAPSNLTAPLIGGVSKEGHTLSAAVGVWEGVAPISYSYQWERCNSAGAECAPVEDQTEEEYELTSSDIGSTLRVLLAAINSGGSTTATAAATAEIQAEHPSEMQAPKITGSPDVDGELHADPGVWSGTESQLSYQWESCSESGEECAAVQGATSADYPLGGGDLSSTLRVRIGVHSQADSLSDVSQPTPVINAPGALGSTRPPVISGSAQVGQELSVDAGGWTGGTGALGYTYQWQSCDQLGGACEDIEGATEAGYVPEAGEAEHRLGVLVTAGDEASHTATHASQVTQPVAASTAPVIQLAPAIQGATLAGQTLTTGTGVFTGEGTLSFAYQWERCTTGESCTAIEGATHATYTLTEADIGARVLAQVSASDTEGSTTAISAMSAVVGPEALSDLSAPSVSGLLAQGAELSANPGIWSATGAVSYAYQWERCETGGEACAAISGANEPMYSPSVEDLGYQLRVTVTATSPLGSESASSALTGAVPGGEASVLEAQESIEDQDPAIFSPSSTATLEEQSITPTLGESEEELAAQSTLASSTISKETEGEFAVETPAGELSIAPVESQAEAPTPPTVVNNTAALFTDSWPATDTIIRPQPLGVSMILALRSNQAPHSFSWQVHLGPDLELQQLPDGSAAVIEAPEEEQAETRGEQPAGEEPTLHDTGESSGEEETSEEKAEAEQAEAEDPEPESEEEAEEGEEAPMESLPTTPHSEATPGEAPAGRPEPQQTLSAYETATSVMSSAEAQTNDGALLAIAAPQVTDAEGNSVPGTLTVTGDTITVNVKPGGGVAYPLLVQATIAAHTNQHSAAHRLVRYGMSDPLAQDKGHIDEHFNEAGEVAAKLDPNLHNGPRNTPRHMRTARLVVPYDTLSNGPEHTKHKQILEDWLRKVGKEKLLPYITLGQNYKVDPCKGPEATPEQRKCPQPTLARYEKDATKLIEEVIHWHQQRHWPLVKLWGAWNEPDGADNPLHHDRPRAAEFWEIANTIMHKIAPHYPCRGCTVVAGEFATYHAFYSSCYRNVILYGYCKKEGGSPTYYHHYWKSKSRNPLAWGFHDYQDPLNRDAHVAKEFAKFSGKRLGKPRLFISEAGVDLQNGKTETALGEIEATTDAKREEKRELQQKAAEDLIGLPAGLSYPISGLNYYQYTAPTKKGQEENEFDSALLEVEKDTRVERPAYCVIGFAKHICPPTVEALPNGQEPSVAVCDSIANVTLKGAINPHGGKTTYYFEYGSTTAYGSKTTSAHKAGWTTFEAKTKVTVSLTENSSNDCLPSMHYRLVAANAEGTRRSPDRTVHYVSPIGS